MTRTYKIVLMAVCAIAIIPTLLIGSRAFRVKQYRDGFSQIEVGQSKETVINLMGKTSEIRDCSFPIYNESKRHIGNCAEIFAYHGVYEQWALAFDKQGNVIDKYYWFLGEYGKRPPDTN